MSQSKPLTFGELAIGDHFVHFPQDGDDSGHGGYRGAAILYKKIKNEERAGPMRLVDNVERTSDGVCTHNPPSMLVLKVHV